MKKLIIDRKVQNLAIILFSFFLLTSGYSKNDVLGFLIKGNEYTLSLLKSGIIREESKVEFSPEFLEKRYDPGEKYEIYGIFKDDKFYQEVLVTMAKSKKIHKSIIAYNGQYTTAIDVLIDKMGKEIKESKSGAIYPEKHHFIPDEYSMIKLFRELMKESNSKKLIGEKVIDGDRCYEIEIETQYSTKKIYLDTDCGYLIKKIISIDKETKQIKSEYVVKKFKKFGNIWYPVEIERKSYNNGKCWQKDYIVVKEFIPNPKIDDKIFTIKFPKGLLIWDGITKRSFFAP